MLEQIIAYFAKRHLLTNFLTILVFIGGIFYWHATPKEALPSIDFNYVSVKTMYPGASPKEVEHFVTKPLEDEIQSVEGIYRFTSNSSSGISTIRIEIDDKIDDLSEVVNEIEDAVSRVSLPSEIRDDPFVRQFKTSKKSIIDIALIYKNKEFLTNKTRKELQKYSLALEDQLKILPEVSSVSPKGYLKEELQIEANPKNLKKYNISLNSIKTTITDAHKRKPAGNLEDKDESKVTIKSELDTVKKLENQIIRGGFDGQKIRLKELAKIKHTFEKSTSITKVNGKEAIIINVAKSSSHGIIESVEAVKNKVNFFEKNSLSGKNISIHLLDDESTDVKDRLSLVGLNAGIGFILIIIVLFLFLNFKAGFWVAMGIPFSFCFTMIITSLMGYTINNVTLSAVIIVMGMVVDDAIVVAENISRLKSEGISSFKASVKGTSYVILPIIASITTTSIAFLPLMMFSGAFAKFIFYIPPIIAIMLLGSLIESIFILPAHMNLEIPRNVKMFFSLGTLPLFERLNKKKSKKEEYPHWFIAVENRYGKLLEKALNYKIIIFSSFITLLVIAGFIFSTKMKFVMFPNEEASEIIIMAEAKEGTKKKETAKLATHVESILSTYLNKEVVGYRTYVATSRHGGRKVEENKFITRIEVISKEKREKSITTLKKEWESKTANIKDLTSIRFIKRRFGQSSGSPIEIQVQENDDKIRKQIVEKIKDEMEKDSSLTNIEIDRPMLTSEYIVQIKQDKLSMLGMKSETISNTLKSILEGTILYELTDGNDDIDVRLTTVKSAKKNMKRVLQFPVENNNNYLIPLRDIVKIKKTKTPLSIQREENKRITKLYAAIYGKESKVRKMKRQEKKLTQKKKKSQKKPDETIKTPIEIAEKYEATLFPKLAKQFPTAQISFGGEVKDTRESTEDFKLSLILVFFLIYSILALLFNSLIKPFAIMITIPFGAVGIILAFWLHGMIYFGFFAAVGAIGLAGVVVNDSIVMLSKMEKEYDKNKDHKLKNSQIADIAKTRLRAVLLTTITTVAGLFPTAYGLAGYDAMLSEMMLAMGWGLLFATLITLILVPATYSIIKHIEHKLE